MKRTTNYRPTPLEKLIAEQRRVRACCRVQEQKLNEDLEYMHRHSGRLLLASLSSLFFRDPGDGEKKEEREAGSADFFGLGVLWKTYSPVFWEMVLPIVLRWGMGKVENLFKKETRSETTR